MGTDTFVFRTGTGNDTVANFSVAESNGFILGAAPLTRDFTIGLDQVQLIGMTFTDLQFAGDTMTFGGDSLRLVGIDVTTLTEDSFIFDIV